MQAWAVALALLSALPSRVRMARSSSHRNAIDDDVSIAHAAFGPFNRRTQLLTILGGAVIGAGSGYLYADSKALERINDLSATSRLRKEVQKLYVGLVNTHEEGKLEGTDCVV